MLSHQCYIFISATFLMYVILQLKILAQFSLKKYYNLFHNSIEFSVCVGLLVWVWNESSMLTTTCQLRCTGVGLCRNSKFPRNRIKIPFECTLWLHLRATCVKNWCSLMRSSILREGQALQILGRLKFRALPPVKSFKSFENFPSSLGTN